MNVYYEQPRQMRFQFGFGKLTHAVQRLILANICVFALQLVLDIPLGYSVSAGNLAAPPGGDAIKAFAFQPSQFLLVWKPFTYQFIHQSLVLHLFFNMLWLFLFGPDVERALGTRQFYRFYIGCGAAAVLATLAPFYAYGIDVSVVGASGATMAVMVAFAVLNPDRQLFLFPLPLPISARGLVILLLVLNLFYAFNGQTGMSVATHLGGMAAGYSYMTVVPRFRRWRRRMLRQQCEQQGSEYDPVGEMVNNIFEFDRKRRR